MSFPRKVLRLEVFWKFSECFNGLETSRRKLKRNCSLGWRLLFLEARMPGNLLLTHMEICGNCFNFQTVSQNLILQSFCHNLIKILGSVAWFQVSKPDSKLLPRDSSIDPNESISLCSSTATFDSSELVLSLFCVSAVTFLSHHFGSDNLCNYGEKRVVKESLSLWASLTCEGQTAGEKELREHTRCAGSNFSNDKAKLFSRVSSVEKSLSASLWLINSSRTY